jgi:threonine/homoserine/homoserine lactone efflux protein
MPGALLTYTLEKSMKSDTKAGLMISLGHALFELALVVLLFLGIGKYLGTALAQMLIGLIGGMVLLYSGFSMTKDAYWGKISIELKDRSDSNNGNMLSGGAIISATNPYLIVWWAAVGLGLIMSAYNLFGIIGIVVFYLGHIMSDITWYVFVSTLIGKTRNFINLKVHKTIIAVLGICLIGFGISFIVSSVKLVLPYL